MGGNTCSTLSGRAKEVHKASLRYKANKQSTLAQIAAQIRKLPEVERFHLLNDADGDGCNSLLWAVSINDKVLVQTILDDCGLNESQQKTMLGSRDGAGYNILHYAARNSYRKLVDYLLSCLSDQSERDNLIMETTNPTSSNALHLLAMRDLPSVCKLFMMSLSAESLTSALLARDINGLTPIQLSVRSGHISSALAMLSRLPELEFSQNIGDLPNTHSDECIDFSLKKQDDWLLEVCTNKCPNKVIERVKQSNCPLTSTQILLLYPLFFDFVIPRDQTLAKKNGLIMYCKVEREGAVEEARVFRSSLESAGFNTQCHEWTRFCDMRSWMTDRLEEMKNTTSLLFIALMGHGFSGNIRGESGSYGEITDAIDVARKQIPDDIPIVSAFY